MEVKIKNTKEIYTMMRDWWEGHNFPVVSPSMLPKNTFVCYNDEGVAAYTMCFYNTDSGLCWLGWQISNPELDKKSKEGCLDFLFKGVENFAKKVGYKVMFTTTGVKPVEKVLTDNKYGLGDKGVNHYLKNI